MVKYFPGEFKRIKQQIKNLDLFEWVEHLMNYLYGSYTANPTLKFYVTNIKQIEQSVLYPLFIIHKMTEEDPMSRYDM